MTWAPQVGWQVRVRDAGGRVCGAAVLVDEWRLVTCAHVVAQALDVDESGPQPTSAVVVDFPSVPGVSRQAWVLTGGWVPVSDDRRGDLALLTLDQAAPPDLVPASLVQLGPPDGRTVHAFGHPPGQDDGVWAETKPVGFGGPGGEWVQMDGLRETGRRVEHGFSGAGVLDVTAVAVVGLVVAEDLAAPNRVAWMLPMEQVVRYLPPLAALLRSAGPLDDRPVPPPELPAMRRPSPVEARELFSRLAAVGRMRDRDARELYMEQVERQLGEAVSWRRQVDDTLDVWALMSALLDRPGSLRALVRVLEGMYPEAGEVHALADHVERVFPDLLLEQAERVELEGLLHGVARGWIGGAYRAATWPYGPAAVPASIDLPQVIRQLEGFGRRGGPPPAILSFVDHLAHKIGGPTFVALHRWIDQVGGRLEADRAALVVLCERSALWSTRESQAVLAVQLQPDRIDADRYLMAAWVHYGPQEERLLLRDDAPRTLDEVAEQLDDVVTRVPEHASADIDELTIEFILPRRLLGHPVEEWEINRSRFSLPIGIRYPVVVRSLERLRDRASHGAWRRKWRWVAEHGHRADLAAIYCAGRAGERSPRALYSELGLEDRRVCLALPFPPPAGSDAAAGDEFAAGIEAGMPVIVWARQPVEPSGFCTLVRGTLAADGIRELPRRALHLRRTALGATPAGRSEPSPPVGVLWDDADRVPGGLRRRVSLQPPEVPMVPSGGSEGGDIA